MQVQRAESQGQRLRECWHLKGGWGRNLKEHEKETPEMEQDLQKEWCHGNQGGEKREGVIHRAGVSERGQLIQHGGRGIRRLGEKGERV